MNTWLEHHGLIFSIEYALLRGVVGYKHVAEILIQQRLIAACLYHISKYNNHQSRGGSISTQLLQTLLITLTRRHIDHRQHQMYASFLGNEEKEEIHSMVLANRDAQPKALNMFYYQLTCSVYYRINCIMKKVILTCNVYMLGPSQYKTNSDPMACVPPKWNKGALWTELWCH